jgi:hypothetical protein
VSKWTQIHQAMHRFFVFLALLCSPLVYLTLFINFNEVTRQADGTYTTSAGVAAVVLTITYLYWMLRGLAYWLSLYKKEARQ